MFAFILVYLRLTESLWTSGSSLRNLSLLLLAAAGAAAILIGMYRILGVEMIKDLRRRGDS